MQKVKVQVTITLKTGVRKEVKVWLDESIYAALLETQNQALLEAYIAEEYYSRNLERRERRHGVSLDEIMDNGHDFAEKKESPAEIAICSEERAGLRAAIQRLPALYQKVVVLHIFESRSYSEIAEMLGLSKARIGKIFQTAKKKLKNFLEKC